MREFQLASARQGDPCPLGQLPEAALRCGVKAYGGAIARVSGLGRREMLSVVWSPLEGVRGEMNTVRKRSETDPR
jgi:hypothetical protein